MTTNDQHEDAQIALMEWDELQSRLMAPSTRGPGGEAAAKDQDLEQFFGPEEFAELKRIAAETRAVRARAPLLGNVVLLPGIMGSNLVTTEASGDTDLIWVNFLRLIGGQLARLQLSLDGSSDGDAKFRVSASAVDKRTYTKALLKLAARWHVEPFPFDWRKSMDTAADALAQLINEKFPDQPVHLVAHSMGGLVSRNFIRLHRDVWEKMRGDGPGAGGGRLIMLGTPNYGSFAIPQALTGVETLVRRLEKADFSHNMQQVLEILNSFVGTYQLLPAPAKLADEVREIYKAKTWGSFPVFQNHLESAERFHQSLEGDAGTIDPKRMFYIAGCNQETLKTMTIQGPGEFKYSNTPEGDGRVPFTLGLLEGVPSFFVEESHGSLPKNDRVLKAVDQLLEHGRTDALPDKPIPPRAFFVPEAPWHRSLGDYLVESELEKIARRADSGKADADEIRFAEEILTRAVVGEKRPVRKPERRTAAKPAVRRRLAIDVVPGDVTRVAAPVVVVGSYKGVVPVNAIGAIDKALDFWISQAIQRSMLGADLGQIFFIPVRRRQIEARAVLVAGMGEEGKFSRYDLRYLMLNVTQAISALEVDTFATVLIGAGAGNLTLETAVRGMLFGICDALERMDTGLRRLVIVEYNAERAKKIGEILDTIKEEESAGDFLIRVTVKEPLAKESKGPEPVRPDDLPREEFGARFTVERDGDVFRFAALTREAVVTMREVEIQSFYSEGIAERLMKSGPREEQELFGRLLNTVIPQDFQQHYQEPLTLILDRNTAGFPWEMACYGRPEGSAYFGTHLGLTRQFRTLLSSNSGIAPRLDDRLRVLVVADPAPEPELQLAGARLEGEEVVRLLRQIKQEANLNIEVIGRIGAEECDPVEILGLILNGNFDIIHFAGHGIYDTERPNRSGWVFGFGKDESELKTLSAREIFLARQVPRLVFSNACFSAVVTKGQLTAEEMNRRLAGLAEAFFERGVPNYIGAGWPVRDDLAVRFATEFYAQALTGRPAVDFSTSPPEDRRGPAVGPPQVLYQAVSLARRLIAHDGSTWGAYQHYGQADAHLLSLEKRAPAAPAERPKARPARKAAAKKAATKKSPAKKAPAGRRKRKTGRGRARR